MYSMWTHPGFRSRESHGLRCSLTGHCLVGSVACCPTILRNHLSRGTWNSSLLPAAVIWTSNILFRSQLGFLLVIHNRQYLFVIQQDTCPACISYIIEFARPTGVLSTYHNPQHQLWLLFWGCFIWGFFFEGNIFSVLSLRVNLKSGLQPPWKEWTEVAWCRGKSNLQVKPAVAWEKICPYLHRGNGRSKYTSPTWPL